jgi:hypothetical protein
VYALGDAMNHKERRQYMFVVPICTTRSPPAVSAQEVANPHGNPKQPTAALTPGTARVVVPRHTPHSPTKPMAMYVSASSLRSSTHSGKPTANR